MKLYTNGRTFILLNEQEPARPITAAVLESLGCTHVKAFMELIPAEQYQGRRAARICGWCPDKKLADEYGRQIGAELTHTICPSCKEREEAALAALGAGFRLDATKALSQNPAHA